ncbi:MAG: UDP-N-acetylmuramoyl-L-alanyl-D-glutamate--2,6-diaminopimelate ligase [Armatimonadota bacterium]|nr:UDP-N-acetylmuramoyl-L-alanyl-D-glutamate--2,6-diaminopimelate ligase [Armatimonadota bacterium]MDR7494142.1 UDP-N-acetylmuramoyl-L-alanyl-D-glutamate--2,6-diaminopimelate ligase [Armatimonadota bacterium]MDR7498892.1 UDP-N-acetylmuramoyl-L-alanyl-D-glutamate--2,6-diaminopimelate ligase [Armatimonadota bacterium]MDR7504399.1 UDP-N-acetylmuramoyl-L-alanyl-D-glutamate--2,6-diaminopimelate ligase [Armatimonadota bacterium]MDR7547538.1 UDP-N-acetylmuramoyl-L-alanyl-D-glutamate--2,6-diaminopimela
MMRLDRLLQDLHGATVRGRTDVEVTHLAARHDAAGPGALFVAVRGFTHDGHTFVSEAVSRGAAVVVVQDRVAVPDPVTVVTVPDTRLALAHLSCAFYGHPSRDLSVIGVTGTNGKGTTAYLIEAMLRGAGRSCGVIGTMGAQLGERVAALDRTTPEAHDFQRLLREMADAGAAYVVAEVASHALALHRVAGTRFSAAVFTNLTQDHLDFHKTLDDYRAAKRRLFEMVEPDGLSVVNADDPSGETMAAASRAAVVRYGLERRADVRAADVELRPEGAVFTLQTPQGHRRVRTRLRGRFNVYNALAAAAAAGSLTVTLDDIGRALETFPGVPGRFEPVDEGQEFGLVVDYAHTPDGLEHVLRAARDFVRGRTIVVFGAGGDRDRTKRPKMGAIAARLADLAIVTSDNPRSEDPEAIIEEILSGVEDRRNIEVQPDRARAIARAIEVAGAGDFIIIAGKGHEPYQEIRGVRYPFDDRRVARDALRARLAARP